MCLTTTVSPSSFHGRLRDKCLNTSWFRTLNDVREKMPDSQQEYNCERPDSSLDYRTPQEFRRVCNGIRATALISSQNQNSNSMEKTLVMAD